MVSRVGVESTDSESLQPEPEGKELSDFEDVFSPPLAQSRQEQRCSRRSSVRGDSNGKSVSPRRGLRQVP